ncbi:hypothetical protein HDU98_009343 [Podochytrium sp. JEL0797]|nr:hypothetical protein HDU98_009343 [Podochytrium sp. JEL0797]
MTLVQDSVLTVLFGNKPISPSADEKPSAFDMESLNMKVAVGLPPSDADLEQMQPRRNGRIEKLAPPPIMKIREYLASLDKRTQKWVDADYDHVLSEKSEDERKVVVEEYARKLQATDLLVRSKTGTGKTLAFVVAAIESVLKSPEDGFRTGSIPILIVAPSRELASQIQTEANLILAAHQLRSVMLVGGEDRAKQVKKIVYDGVKVDLIVATPGRLLDMLQNVPKLKKRLSGLKVLIYDEADLLLEHGFQASMEHIQSLLPPPSTRQTFMFSATFSPQIKRLASGTLRHDKTVSLDTVPTTQVPTHLTTKQTHIHSPFSLQPQLLLHLLESHTTSTPFPKIIVFFPTTHLTQHLSHVFNEIPGMEVMELHSQMDQRARRRVSDRFRACRNGVLFTSDVSARGVDYPDVTLVVQMGVPRNLEQYIHRIGRTGRAGKPGTSILVHSSYETPFLVKALQGSGGLPIKRDTVHDPQLIARDAGKLAVLKEAYRKGDWAVGSACYAAFLGYYRGLGTHMPLPASTLVKAADEFALGLCGLPQVPKVGSGLLTRLGIAVADGVKVLTPKEEAEVRGKEAPVANRWGGVPGQGGGKGGKVGQGDKWKGKGSDFKSKRGGEFKAAGNSNRSNNQSYKR